MKRTNSRCRRSTKKQQKKVIDIKVTKITTHTHTHTHNQSSFKVALDVTWPDCTFSFFSFLGLHPWHMEVSKLGVKSALQLLAYTTTTAMSDPSRVCNLHHSSLQGQGWNLHPYGSQSDLFPLCHNRNSPDCTFSFPWMSQAHFAKQTVFQLRNHQGISECLVFTLHATIPVQHLSKFPSFLQLNLYTMYIYILCISHTDHVLFIPPFTERCVASTFWLL